VDSWSLGAKLAQLELVGVTFGQPDLPAYGQEQAGGVYYLGQPAATDGPSISSTNAAIQAQAAAAGAPPLFIATDEEGGGVARLSNVIGALPWEQQQAQDYTPAQLQQVMAGHAAAMAGLGFNMDLAPVVDTAPPGDTIGDEGLRSYSENGQTAAAYGVAASRGLEAGGVVPVLKHFPGLGHANGDTDDGPASTPPLSQLQGDDLIPFAQGIAAGAPAVMVSNATVPGLTNGLPASLSPASYTYLQASLGFGGLTMTDALDAGAISGAGYTQPAAAVAAVEAGDDLVLIDGDQFSAVVAALTQAVNTAALPIARVNAAVEAILTAKGVPACPTVAMAPSSVGGYWLAASDGTVTAFGTAVDYGSADAAALTGPVVGMAGTADGRGYWLATSDGGVLPFGDAQGYGSEAGQPLRQPIVGMTRTPDGRGYWLVAADGGVFSFGDAHFYGSTGNIRLNQPIVGMASTNDGGGYWLVAADGGVFAFGDAAFDGSTGNIHLNQPVVNMAETADGHGYWLVASDGGIFAFGDAGFYGSTGNIRLNRPVVDMAPTPDARGYWLAAADGGIFAFGDAPFEGSNG
jgi:beta-glucosidase-like glycosyl hydrolase